MRSAECICVFVLVCLCICIRIFFIFDTWYPDVDPMRSCKGGEEEEEGGGGYAREEEQHRPEIVGMKYWIQKSGHDIVGTK